MKFLAIRKLYSLMVLSCAVFGVVGCEAASDQRIDTQGKYGALILSDLGISNGSVLATIEKVNQAIQNEGIKGLVFTYDLELDLKFSKDSTSRYHQLSDESVSFEMESGTVEEVATELSDAYGLTFGFGNGNVYFYPRFLFEVKHNLNRMIAPRLQDDAFIGNIALGDLIEAINVHLVAHDLKVKLDSALTDDVRSAATSRSVYLSAKGSMALGDILDLIALELGAELYYQDEVIFLRFP